MTPSQWLSVYTFLIALLISGSTHALVAAYVFAIRKTQTTNGWHEGTGFGALVMFCVFYLATAYFVPKKPPKTCMRWGTRVFLVFAVFSLLPLDPTIFIISFALLGFVAMAQSVLLSWWGKKQVDRTNVVVARMAMINVASNIPLAIFGALLNAQGVDFRLAFAVIGLITGVATLLLLMRCTAISVFHQEIADSTVVVNEYQSDPMATVLQYDSDEDVFVTMPRMDRRRHTLELSEIKSQPKEPQLTLTPHNVSAQDRKDIALQLSPHLGNEDNDDNDEPDVPSQVCSSSAPSSSASSSCPLPINRPTFVPPTNIHHRNLKLWLGLWTWMITFTTESLLYYNIAGFSRSYDTPWYIIVVVVTMYTALIMASLFVFTRVGNSYRRIRYLWWYRMSWYLLLVAAFLNALLMTTSYGTNYAWHSGLSVMYMLPLTVVSTMPLSRAQELCQRYNYTLHALLPGWTFAVASARAAAYCVEYLVLYYDRQLSMMFILAFLNAQVYFQLRRLNPNMIQSTTAESEPTDAVDDEVVPEEKARDAASSPQFQM